MMKKYQLMKNRTPYFLSVFQALLVTFLWSTSFIIIKLGLVEIPPLTFAGLRYFLAFLCFIPFIAFKKTYIDEIKQLSVSQWNKLILLGILFYAFTQSAQFLGLSLLPSVTVSLILNFTPILVAFLGLFILKENPTHLQWIGVILFIIGVLTYFIPVSLFEDEHLGLIVMLFGVLSNAGSAVIGRNINREKNISPIVVTFVSMGIGATILLTAGIILKGVPAISIKISLYLIWLSVVNTALAFTLWNITLRILSAMESSIINGTMLIQIAVLAWIFLGEKITLHEGIGMFIAAIGALLVQLKYKPKN